MKNKRTIVLSIIIFLSITYIVLFSFYIRKYKMNDKGSSNATSINKLVTVDKVLKFINNYKIDYLDNINDSFTISSLTNQEKLQYLYLLMSPDVDFTSGVSAAKLEKKLTEVFGITDNLIHEDLMYEGKLILSYDENKKVYILNQDENYNLNYSIYNHVISYEFVKDSYMLKVNKFFVDGNKVYASIDDKENNKVLFEVPFGSDGEEYIKNYVINNYESIKDFLHEYDYIFARDQGNLILISYNIVNEGTNVEK